MIKRPAWVLLVILTLVCVAYFMINNRNSATSTEPTPTSIVDNFLVTQADGILQSLRIFDSQNHLVQMQRDIDGTWIITLPTPGTADLSLAGAVETQVGALRIVSILDDQLSLREAGLDFPAYTIELTFISGFQHVIQIGMLTPTNSGYYIRYDAGNLYVISQPGIDALLNLLTSPPLASTETPIPTIGETTTPSIAVATPTP